MKSFWILITAFLLSGCRQRIASPVNNAQLLKLSDLKFDDFQKDALMRNGVVSDSIVYSELSYKGLNKQPEMYLIDSFGLDGNKSFYGEHSFMGGHYRYKYDKYGFLESKKGGSCLYENYQFRYFFFPERRILCRIQSLNERTTNSICIFSFMENGQIYSCIDYSLATGAGNLSFYRYDADGNISVVWNKNIAVKYSLIYQTMTDNLLSILVSKKKFYYHGKSIDSTVIDNQMFNDPKKHLFSRQYFDDRGLIVRELLFERGMLMHNYTLKR